MEADVLKYRIALTKLKGVGSIYAKNLLAQFGDERPIFEEGAARISQAQGISSSLAKEIVEHRAEALQLAEKEMLFLQKKSDVRPIFFTDSAYPYRLKECIDAPLLLYTRGNCDFNTGKFLAVVGTRKVTAYGRELTERLVQSLAERHTDLTIVSGLAFGVDICSHKAALNAQLPTIGVVAHGLDRIYPSSHSSTADKMLERGAVVTEYAHGVFPESGNFVQRNRIIAGMCDAVVVVESAKKGGALITAEFANSYNRDVFCFPGRVDDTSSQGCNNLIMNNKAALIQSAEDLERMMGWDSAKKDKAVQLQIRFDEMSAEEQKIVTFLNREREAHINHIAIETGIAISSLASILIDMEFKDIIKCLPGNTYRLRL